MELPIEPNKLSRIQAMGPTALRARRGRPPQEPERRVPHERAQHGVQADHRWRHARRVAMTKAL